MVINKSNDSSYKSKWWNVLCFFFPLVGLILFLVFIDNDKKFSKKCGLFALIGFIVYVILFIILLVSFIVYCYFYILEHGGM